MAKRKPVQTSGAAPRKKTQLAPLADPTTIAERFKDFPAIEVLSRRFTNPNDPGTLPILLADEDPDACTNSEHVNRLKPGATRCHLCGQPARKWFVYWFNLGREGRNAQMRSKGYVPVEIEELPDANDISDLYRSREDVYVRRGDHGKEILGKMPLEAYLYIKANQREKWNRTAVSPKKVRESIAEAAGAELGDEAGQEIHDGAIQVESFTRTRTTLGEEAGLAE